MVFSFSFSEWQNNLHLFKSAYYYWIYFFVALLFVYYLWPYAHYILALPFLFLVLHSAYRAILPKQDLVRLNFLLALLIALFSFFEKEGLYFLFLPFLLGLFFGGLDLRSFLSLLLGYGAVLYFTISIDFFFETNIMANLGQSWLNLELHWPSLKGVALYSVPAIGVHLLLSVIVSFSGIARYNNEQKRILAFWLLILVFAFVAFLSLGNKGLWLSLGIFPYAFFASRAVQSIENRWLKESLALGPIAIYLLAVFL